jgi:hypothetical protein
MCAIELVGRGSPEIELIDIPRPGYVTAIPK